MATTNYSLPVFSSTDSVDLIGVYNAAMQIIDTKLKSIDSQMGTLSTKVDNVQGFTRNRFAIHHDAGLLDLQVTGCGNVFWQFPDGTTSTSSRVQKTVTAGITYLYATEWRGQASTLTSNYVTQTALNCALKDIPPLTYYLNLGNCSQVTGSLADAPRVTNYLDLYNCPQITGTLADAPRVTDTLNLGKCPQVTGTLADAPRVTNYLNLYNCQQVAGTLADAPRVTNFLNLSGCPQITGTLADAPRVTNYLNLSGCQQVAGTLADAPRVTNFLSFVNCPQVTGVLSPTATLKNIYLQGTGMTPSDTDQTLINLAAITTVTSGGILQIKHNRTSASDAAVASLAGKFTIKEV